MDSARVYKIKIKDNILRQVIFTNRNIFLGIIIFTSLSVWKCLYNLPTDIKVFISIMLSGILLLFFTIQIDRQTILKVFPRIFKYLYRKKKNRF